MADELGIEIGQDEILGGNQIQKVWTLMLNDMEVTNSAIGQDNLEMEELSHWVKSIQVKAYWNCN